MTKPNILFICADDLCTIEMLKLLIPGFEVPNYERLARSGTDFRRAYCAVPICEPARTASMTGLSPFATRSFALTTGWEDIVRPENLWTYRLREAGYKMYTQGKIFHGYVPQPAHVYEALYDDTPFTFSWRPSGTATDYGGVSPLLSGSGYDAGDEAFYDGMMVNRAIRKLTDHDPDSGPFYCELGFKSPHTSFEAPNRFFDMVPLDSVMLPAEWPGGWESVPFAADWIDGNWVDNNVRDPAQWPAYLVENIRKSIRSYAACVKFLDSCIGTMLVWLEASPYADNTIVSFYSDHGYHLSDHSRFHKFTLYEQAAAAPMLIRVPGQTPRVIDQPVSHLDIGITLLDYAGVDQFDAYRGKSVREFIETGEQDRGYIPTFWFSSSSVIGPELKRVTVYSNGDTEMFDIAADPWAKVNIRDTDPDMARLRDIAIETAYDWGLLLVEQAIDMSRPSLIQNHMDTTITSPAASTTFMALGDFTSKGWSPHYQKMWGGKTGPRTGGATNARMPAHVTDYQAFGWGFQGAAQTITMNERGNRLNTNEIKGDLTVDMRGGDDIMGTNVVGNTLIIARGGKGNDILRLGARDSGVLYGDDGDDIMYGSDYSETFYGGNGDDRISAGGGNDTIFGGQGDDAIDAGSGNDTIHLDGGSDTVTGGTGNDTFILYKTGREQVITDLARGTNVIDLSRWAGIQPINVVQSGADVIVSKAMERLVCKNVTRAKVVAEITGAQISA